MRVACLIVMTLITWSGKTYGNPLQALKLPAIELNEESLAKDEAIGRHLALSSDKNAEMTPESILAGKFNDVFFDSDGRRSYSFGANRSWPHWALFAIHLNSPSPKKILLESEYVATDKLTVYQMAPTGEVLSSEMMGDQLAFSARHIQYRHPVYYLNLQPGLNYVLLKMDTSSIVVFDLKLYSENKFHNIKMRELVNIGLLLGGIFTILIYNLFLFLSTKDKSYGIYIIYVASFLLYSMSYYGITPYFLFSDMDEPPLTGWGLYILIDLISIGACLFGIKFLVLKENLKWFYHILNTLIIAATINIGLALFSFGEISSTKIISLAISFLMGPILVAAGIIRRLTGYGPAAYFTIAWTFVIGGNTLVLLANVGILEKNFITSWSQLIGANLEMLFLSFALGARINLIKAEKLEAEKHAREASAKALTEERRLNEQRDQLVANTSHELRTPLNGMMGLVQAIIKREGEQLSAETQRSLQGIVVSSKRLAALIGDLLDFSRGQRQQIPLYCGHLAVAEQAQHVLDLLEPTLEGRDVKLQMFIPEDLPAIYADPDRFQQILFNLLGNACKFTNQGHIEISAKEDGDRVFISVEDTGPGIEEDAQARIFEAFAQADGGIARKFGGTGLGLAIVKQLVESHGGEIGLQSIPGFGSTFWFSLPISQEEHDTVPSEISRSLENRMISLRTQMEAGKANQQTEEISATPIIPLSGAQLNILVVDDEPMNRQVLEELLSLEGHRITLAQDGHDALRIMRDFPTPDLILLDVMMPGMSGFQVLSTLRIQYNEAELPIILLTAKALAKDLVEGFSLGASDYILKPFVVEEVEARISHQARLKFAIWETEAAREEGARVRQQLHQTEDQLLHAERLASIGAATAGIAHDLGNPLHHVRTSLGWIRNHVEKIENVETLPEAASHEINGIHETISLAEKATITAIELAQVIRVAVRTDDAAIGLVDIKAVVDDVLTILQHKLKHFELSCHCAPDLAVRGKRSELIQLIMNLLSNAADAIIDSEKKELAIHLENKDGKVCITVEDSGPGVPEKLRSMIFDPFYTTKPSGKGTGLGLMVVQTVAKHQGGSLSIDDSPKLGGARFTIMMPAA
ncbi:MAG: ATP-binding protein [Oligoflexus sp.]